MRLSHVPAAAVARSPLRGAARRRRSDRGAALADGAFTAPQKAGIEKIVHDYLIANPEVIREAIDELKKREEAAELAMREKAVNEQGDKIGQFGQSGGRRQSRRRRDARRIFRLQLRLLQTVARLRRQAHRRRSQAARRVEGFPHPRPGFGRGGACRDRRAHAASARRNSGNSTRSCSRRAAISARRRRSPPRRKSAPTWTGSRRTRAARRPQRRSRKSRARRAAQIRRHAVLGHRQGGDRRRPASRAAQGEDRQYAQMRQDRLLIGMNLAVNSGRGPARGDARRASFAPTMRLRETARRASGLSIVFGNAMPAVHVLNGPNLNLLGKREPAIYGTATLDDIRDDLDARCKARGVDARLQAVELRGRSRHLDSGGGRRRRRRSSSTPGALTHTSIALYDAIKGAAGLGHRGASLQRPCAGELPASFLYFPGGAGRHRGLRPAFLFSGPRGRSRQHLRKTEKTPWRAKHKRLPKPRAAHADPARSAVAAAPRRRPIRRSGHRLRSCCAPSPSSSPTAI